MEEMSSVNIKKEPGESLATPPGSRGKKKYTRLTQLALQKIVTGVRLHCCCRANCLRSNEERSTSRGLKTNWSKRKTNRSSAPPTD